MFKNTMLLVISLFVLGNISFAQTNITRVEYYVDTDPGYGNALAASITNSPDVTTTINVPVNNFTPGLHIVGVRSRDANGVWSFDERWLLLKPAAADIAANINKVEWYLDTDPGYDKATVFNGFTAATDVANISIPVNISNISTGLHIAGIRTRDAVGKWSFDERWLILKQDTARIASKIDKVEWYLDTDPGYDKATSVNVTAALDIVNIPFSPDITNLNTGLHILGVRSRNAEKSWSFDERWLILKQDTAVKRQPITYMEYFIDSLDPGRGKAFPLALRSDTNIANLVSFVNVTGLDTGWHKIHYRSKDANGAWSFEETVPFKLTNASTAPFISLNSVASAEVCKGGNFLLGYHATGSFNQGNQFIAELSDAVGNFANPVTIGLVTSSTGGGTISTIIPQNAVDGYGYKIRIRSTSPALASNATNQNISLNKSVLGNDTSGLILCVERNYDLTKFYEPLGAAISWSIASPTEAPVGIYSVYATNAVGCKDTALFEVTFFKTEWLGTVSTDWHTAGNWSNNKVPNDSTHVIVKSTASRQCIISSSDAAAASIQILAGAPAVLLSNNRKLLIKGDCKLLPK